MAPIHILNDDKNSMKTNQEILMQVAERYLDVADIASLSLCTSSLCAGSELLWKRLVLRDFVTIHKPLAVLHDVAGLTVPVQYHDYLNPSKTWKIIYKSLYSQNDESLSDHMGQLDIQESETVEFKDDEMKLLFQQLLNAQNEDSDSVILLIIEKLIEQLRQDIMFIPSYYYLAYLCFVLNRLEAALQLANLGRDLFASVKETPQESSNEEEALDEDFYGPLDELAEEIECLLYSSRSLLVDMGNKDYQLSKPAKRALTEIFSRFLPANNDKWTYTELVAYIHHTKQIPSQGPYSIRRPSPHVPVAMYQQLLKRFGTREGLHQDGFLEFYLVQTLEDPEETQQDLQKCGYGNMFA